MIVVGGKGEAARPNRGIRSRPVERWNRYAGCTVAPMIFFEREIFTAYILPSSRGGRIAIAVYIRDFRLRDLTAHVFVFHSGSRARIGRARKIMGENIFRHTLLAVAGDFGSFF